MAERNDAVWNRSVFVADGRTIAVGDVMLAAHFRGELQPAWTRLLLLVECEKRAADFAEEDGGAPDEAALQSRSDEFRYERELISAEETDRWLEDRGLTLEDFNAYFLRHYWADTLDEPTEPEALDFRSAPDAFRDLLRAELLLSGEFDRMARALSWRFAAAHVEGNQLAQHLAAGEPSGQLNAIEPDDASLQDWSARLGCDPGWLGAVRELETAYQRHCERLLTAERLEHSLGSLRLPLTRLELETIDLDSLDAVREALLCVREDGAPMSEVAADGRYPYRRTEVVVEDLPAELQQKLLSAVPGEVLEPLAHADGFQLCRLLGKTGPDLTDDHVRDRVERQILERHFSELTARCVRWLLALDGTP